MRLLHVHSGNLYGGVEALLLTLSRFREAAPLVQEFALCFDGRIADELRSTGVQVHTLGEVRTRHPWTILRARKRLRDLLRERTFDAAACHMPWAQAIFGPIARAAGIPAIFWMHDIAQGRHWLERWSAQTAPTLAICNSRYTALTLAKLYPRTPSEILYAPVALETAPFDDDQCIALRASLGTAASMIVIVQASRFEPWKGHRDHLEALGRLTDLPGWECWIVGGAQRPAEQKYRDGLRRRTTELGLDDRVRFCGQRSDVPQLLRAADIYCQPNTEAEPFGIVFAEALGASLPIVTTGLGGVAELVDESCGLRVPPGNRAALAAALRRLITDAKLRECLGATGIRRVEQLCDPARQIGRLNTILGSIAQPLHHR